MQAWQGLEEITTPQRHTITSNVCKRTCLHQPLLLRASTNCSWAATTVASNLPCSILYSQVVQCGREHLLAAAFADMQWLGLETLESMVRILRVLRVFRVFRLGKRLRNEVQMRLLTLIFTLLAIIITSAGLFYEIETRFGNRYPDLTIEQSIYWSVVTTTTIGEQTGSTFRS